MRLRYLVLGSPLWVLWFLFFTVSPLPAVIVLLIALGWLDHRHRHPVFRVPPVDDEAEVWSK